MAQLLLTAKYLFICIVMLAIQVLASQTGEQDSHSLNTRDSPTHSSQPSIRSLFQGSNQLTYPPIDVSGPRPRDLWIDAYNHAKKAGLIPAIPQTKIVNYRAVYPTSYKGNPCSFSNNKCNATDDVHNPPANIAGISFDDGRQPLSGRLLSFLQQNSLKATHFLVGSRILSNPDVFKKLDQAGQHLACHTYSHPMLTSLTDEQIVGELGWVMQIIYDKSAGQKICHHWRPPYGELDDRVRAIARHVFGLVTVTWSLDSLDWCLSDTAPNKSVCSPGNGPQSFDDLKAKLDGFARTPKQQGLMILQHEHVTRAVMGFEYIYPIIKRLGWIIKSVPEFLNQAWYQ